MSRYRRYRSLGPASSPETAFHHPLTISDPKNDAHPDNFISSTCHSTPLIQSVHASLFPLFLLNTEPFLDLIVVSTCSDERTAAESAEVLGNLMKHQLLTISNPKEALPTRAVFVADHMPWYPGMVLVATPTIP